MAEENLEEEVEILDVEEADADDSEEQEELSDEELDRIADTAIAALQDILKYFNVGEVTIDEYEGDDGELILDITGDDLAVLIGRHGKTLDALQFLVSAITVRTIGFRYPVVIDVEGYKSRQRQKLESIARSSANRAASQHRSVKLRPMTPYERRIIHITLPVASECIQRKVVKYDKSGDNHYDTISAFIKSMRGSDPDAAVYYLAKMLYAGEDIKFIARRIMICASEDVGNADPMALTVAVSASQAVERIGMPEAQIILSQAVTYVATAPKSNAACNAIFDAMASVKRTKTTVPSHLQDAHYKGAQKLGHGIGYKYAHNYPHHYVEQQYLPDEIVGEKFYVPSENGHEKEIKEWMRYIREDQ